MVASIIGFKGVHPAVSKCWTGMPTRNKTHRLRSLPKVLEEWKQRFANVRLENDDWRKVIDRYDRPGVLLFCDCTYYPGTCSDKLYRYNLTVEDHEALLERAQHLQAYCMICGYDNPLYQERLANWQRMEFKTRSFVSARKPERIEVIWMNYLLDEVAGKVKKTWSPVRNEPKSPRTPDATRRAPTTIPMPQPPNCPTSTRNCWRPSTSDERRLPR
jgi:site-specific DNA-adenine methylase